jgi:hypothetical protein
MDEEEWLECPDPDEMLRFVREKVSERTLRLFACACCRRIWDRITEDSSRRAVRISELYADGRAPFKELHAAFVAADKIFSNSLHHVRNWHANDAARLAAHLEMRGLSDGTATAAAMAGASGGGDYWKQYAGEKGHQCILLREIFGNPFRSVEVDPSWLAWNSGIVPKLAHAIYEDRTFDRLPILADALEEAGCDNADILSHLRGPEPHVRGCWVVDLILGKE